MIQRSLRARAAILPTAAALMVGLTAGVAAAADLPYRGDGHIMLTPDQLQWTDIASMAAPAEIAVIEGDLTKAEPFTFRLRLPAGYRIEPHIHPEYERLTVLSGTLHFAHGETFDRDQAHELPAGSVAIMAPGEPMFGFTEVDTVIQLHGTGPWGINYVDPADDPRS
ncbi:MAG: cupin [Rhodospirillales bacterium]|nr:MAG: cupin [Rhodospirillales bacterium]